MSYKVYVAGPMRGYDQFNFPAFDEAANYCRRVLLWEAVSPADMDRELGFDEQQANSVDGFDFRDALRRDVEAVANVDGIVLLPGWEKSSGVAFEIAAAKFIGLDIWYFLPRVYNAHTNLHQIACVSTLDPATEEWPNVWAQRAIAVTPVAKTAPQFSFYGAEPVQIPVSLGEFEFVGEISGEERTVDPVTGGEKGKKLARYDLLPAEPLRLLAEHYGRGARKYDDRNWERGYSWSLSFAAMMRHAWSYWNGEDVDEETGSPHLIAVAWHALALVEFARRGIGTDDRAVGVEVSTT